jgi:ring-1,2-phenylacetyl-CoA epoxidase subunit PaaC
MDYGMNESPESESIMPALASLVEPWNKAVGAIIAQATLELPKTSWAQNGGRIGKHTEHLSYMLAEMQILPRTYPDAKW